MALLVLAALRGDQALVSELTEATTRDAMSRGEGIGITVAEWANAMLNNGIGQLRQGDDHRAARRRTATDIGVSAWGTVELIEAAVRGTMMDTAARRPFPAWRDD